MAFEEKAEDLAINVANQISTHLMWIVKYRATVHSASEYPLFIDKEGISCCPLCRLHSSQGLSKRISAGIPFFDQMLGDKGHKRWYL
jgi:hypothetical protein